MAVGAAEWCFRGNNGQTFIDYQIYGVTTLIGMYRSKNNNLNSYL